MEWIPELWGILLTGASALVLLANAAEKIVLAVKAAKAPEQSQNERLEKVESEVNEIKNKLDRDKQRLDASENANHVTQEALLALLEHGLNGNNVEQMTQAKSKLQNYLINH